MAKLIKTNIDLDVWMGASLISEGCCLCALKYFIYMLIMYVGYMYRLVTRVICLGYVYQLYIWVGEEVMHIFYVRCISYIRGCCVGT